MIYKKFFWRTDTSINGQRDEVIEQRFNGDGSVFSTTKIDWTYDALNRLTSETYDAGNDGVQNGNDYTDVFAYDLSSNRMSKTHDAVGTAGDKMDTDIYNDDDQLTSETANVNGTITVTSYGYDLNGSQTTVTHGGQTRDFVDAPAWQG